MDPLLPTFTKQATRWLERNNTFRYMIDTVNTTLPLGETAAFTALGLPTDRLKSIEEVVIQVPDGLVKVRQVTATDWVEVPKGVPTLYWIDWKNNLLEWNAQVVDPRPVKIRFAVFSEVPDSLYAETWLTQNASDVLLYQAVVQFAMLMRDTELAQNYAAMRDQGLRTLALQQEAQEQTNSELWMGSIREPYA